jgi:glycosyltransferase involved in cell wall biosynthesis
MVYRYGPRGTTEYTLSASGDFVAVAQAEGPDVLIVLTDMPGKGAALFARLQAATGDVIVMLDADGSMDPLEIPMFVEALVGGADIALGS